jgi:hypothetical protein
MQQNEAKYKATHELASLLFPNEEWIQQGENIFVAKSRLSGSYRERAKLYREISDIRILTKLGSIAFFLPECLKHDIGDEHHNMHADTVVDGTIVELKTISGNRATLGKSFRRGYKQGRSLLKNMELQPIILFFFEYFHQLVLIVFEQK